MRAADRQADDGDLCASADLQEAARLSSVAPSAKDRFQSIANAFGVFADRVRYKRSRAESRAIEVTIGRGTVHGSPSKATVVYAGHGINRDWCLGTTLSARSEVESVRFESDSEAHDAVQAACQTADVAFVEGLDVGSLSASSGSFVQCPGWVKQRTRVELDWNDQLSAMRRGTRQEVRRALRKHGYTCAISHRAKDADRFFESLYRPYIETLFGKSAIVIDRERFLRECRRGAVLQLQDRHDVISAALLRPVGRTMSIVWIGMEPAGNSTRIPGAADALDYFSLLYAHLKRSRWLDFGPSRADLCDGTLRYKRKWGSEITSGYFRQPSIYWRCNTDSPAAVAFLEQHAFISNARAGLTALLFATGKGSLQALEQRLRQLAMPGIAEFRIVSLVPVGQQLRSRIGNDHPSATIVEVDSVAAAVNSASLPDIRH